MIHDEASKTAYLREKILADALIELASELRLIDAGDLISYIRTHSFANISDLVASSAELYFRPGTISFACRADAHLHWNSPLCVGLDLEFRHLGITVFFNLSLREATAAVDIQHIDFDGLGGDSQDNTALLRSAVTDAKRIKMAH